MTGVIFSVEEFSVYDGPGIRTTVFLKGCPLRCSWCHNPEGQRFESEIVKSPNGCINCGECEKHAEDKDGRTVFTEASIKNCPMNLLRTSGDDVSAQELATRLLRNSDILNMGGGVTFSGGEPFSQSEFLFECLSLLRGKLHTAVQTSGYASRENFLKALSLADYFLYDLKIIDSAEHRFHTGLSNEKIIENYKALAKSGVDFVTRIPLIPGVTDTEKNITLICELMQECGVAYAELLPYNKMAGGKYRMLGREYTPTFDEGATPNAREDVFGKYGITVKIL